MCLRRIAELLISENHIIGGHGGAVAEFGLGPQIEGHGTLVVGDLGAFRDQAVHCVRLVLGANHQAVEQKFQSLGGIVADDELVEAVEGQHRGHADRPERAALGCVGIDVVEMLEVGGVFQFPESGQAVPFFSGLRGKRQQAGDDERCENCVGLSVHHALNLYLITEGQFDESFAALAWSYHQIVGKPMDRDGSGSGWAYLSQ